MQMVLYIVDLGSVNLEIKSNLRISFILMAHASALSGSQMQEASPKGSKQESLCEIQHSANWKGKELVQRTQ